ncbi:MAG: integrase core domain-containing protein [Methylocystis sp.]
MKWVEPHPNPLPYGERRDECLDGHWFETWLKRRRLIEAWTVEYNESRARKALGDILPSDCALRQ